MQGNLNLGVLMAMPMASPAGGDYDAYAGEYAPNVAWREQGGSAGDPFGILPRMLEVLGDVSGQHVLDAGCGEGYLARVLADSGARVTGMDISPRLIEQARKKNPSGDIDYRVADLSQPQPSLLESFPTAPSLADMWLTTSILGQLAHIADCGLRVLRSTTTTTTTITAH